MALIDIVKKGSTDRSITLAIVDSTDGTPETGVVFNTSGIDLWYRREGAAAVDLTEATLAALTTAHTDGGFLHISDGIYRLDVPDAAFATGANYVDFGGTVTGMVVYGGRVRLVDYDPENSVRLGLTALPNAAADAAGGLPVSDAGGLDLDTLNSNVSAILVDTGTTLDGKIDTIDTNVDSILADTGTDGVVVAAASKTGYALSASGVQAIWDALTSALSTASSIGKLLVDNINATISSRLASSAYTAPLDAAGVRTAVGLASANLDTQLSTIDSNVDAVLVDTAEIGAAGAGLTEAGGTGDQLTAVPWNAAWDAEVQSEAEDALAAYDPPTKAELDVLGTAALATQTSVDTIDNFLDTEIADILVDTGTTLDDFVDDLETRLTAALSAKLIAHAAAVLTFTVDASSTTTAVILKTVEGTTPSATDDFYNGAVMVFTSGTLAGQRTSISDYNGTTKTATVVALTGAPAEDVTGVIV